MSEITFLSQIEGLTVDDAKDRASRYKNAYKDHGGPQIDGDSLDLVELDFQRRVYISPDQKVWSVGAGYTAWDDPRTSGLVASWQKNEFITGRLKAEGYNTTNRLSYAKGPDNKPIIDTRTGEKVLARPPEYDRFVFNMTPNEVAKLGGPDSPAVAEVLREFVDLVSRGIDGQGRRAIEVEPFHTDGSLFHLHVTVSRMPYDTERKMMLPTVFMPTVSEKQLDAVSDNMTTIKTVSRKPDGASAVTPEVRSSVVNQQQEAGITPRPEMRSNAISEAWKPKLSGHGPASPDSPFMAAFSSIDRVLIRRQKETQEYFDIQKGLEEAGALYDRNVVLTNQVSEITSERDQTILALSHADSVIAGEPERITTAIKEAVEPVRSELTIALTDLARLDAVVQSEPDRIEKASKAAVEPVRAALTAAQDHAAGEPARVTEAVQAAVSEALEPVQAQLAEMRLAFDAERIAREAVVADLTTERESFADRARVWAQENVVGPLIARAEAAEQSLATARQEIADFPARMEAEISRRMEVMETRLQASLDRMMQTAQSGFQAALSAKDQIIDGLRVVAAAPAQGLASVAAGVAQRAEGTAQAVRGEPRRPTPGADYASVLPDQWTDQQRQYAERALARFVSQGKLDPSTSLEGFGAEVHRQFVEKNQPSQPEAPDQGGAPPRRR